MRFDRLTAAGFASSDPRSTAIKFQFARMTNTRLLKLKYFTSNVRWVQA